MNRPCQFAITCPGTDLPFLNASSEAIDTLDYLGFGFAYGPGGGIPPMQQDWTLTACGVALFHSTSPIDAQLQAIADSIQCDALQRYPDQPLNSNNSEICCQPNPNGETCYTIDHGVIGGRTQAEADQRAAALACYFARRTHDRTFRLNTLAGGCLNAPYVQDIIPSGGVPPYIIEITGGTLPPGVGFFQADPRFATLSGQPSQSGNFIFTVQVSDIAGNVLLRQDVTVAVLAITNSILPPGTVGTIYSEQLLASGGTGSYTFTTGAGFLPDGLSMNSAGLITGTPTVSEDTLFTVTLTDSAGNTCKQQCEINVMSSSCPSGAAPTCDLSIADNTDFGTVVPDPSQVSDVKNFATATEWGEFTLHYIGGAFSDSDNPDPGTWKINGYTFILGSNSVGVPGGNESGYASQAAVEAQFNGFTTVLLASTFPVTPQITFGRAAPATLFVAGAPNPTWKLVRTKKLKISLPTQIRIHDFSSVKMQLSACPACAADLVHPEWDGTFPNRNTVSPSFVQYRSAAILLSLLGKQLTNFETVSFQSGGQPTPSNCGWMLEIACEPGPIVIWRGVKMYGDDPVGCYTRTAGCSTNPPLMNVESY